MNGSKVIEVPINEDITRLLQISNIHRDLLKLHQMVQYHNQTHNKKWNLHIAVTVFEEGEICEKPP